MTTTTSIKTTANKRITTKMDKATNLPTAKSTIVTIFNSPMVSSKKLSTPSSTATSLLSATALALDTKSLALTPTKIDPYSLISFAAAASTSVSMARMSTMKKGIMNYHNAIAMLTLLFLFNGLAGVDGLKCYMCGQYNEGVGSITPCLNYSEQYAHLYLKDCLKSSEKYCVKYVSELSTVRDCATECAEKEVWETKTHCCNTDGCNGAETLQASIIIILMPVLYFIYRALKAFFNTQH